MNPETSSSKALVLCADDFSLNAEVSAGILDLLAAGRLSALSCMTQSPGWPDDAGNLKPMREKADIGLHLNFTQPFSDTLTGSVFTLPLPLLMAGSLLHLLPRKLLRASICQQLDNFERAMGTAPDFIDGHQHVHVFPQIRDCLLEECVKRYGNSKADKKPWLRSLVDLRAEGGIKGRVVQMLGAHACHAQFIAQGFAHNTAFAGLYNLQPDASYDKQMHSWLNVLPTGGLIMCHPARAFVVGDAHPEARVAEYHYFMGDTWLRAMADANVALARGSQLFR